MKDTVSQGAQGYGDLERRVLLWLSLGYPFLYTVGYLSKSVAGAAAIWPAHALAFAAYLLLRLRLWPLIALGVLAFEVLRLPLLHWAMIQSGHSWAES